MASLKLELVTSERLLYSGDVEMVLAPGLNGQLGILPHHAPLLAALAPGALKARVGAEDVYFAIGSGFIEVFANRVVVFADVAERAEEIDLARAEEARRRAEALLRRKADVLEFAKAEAGLRRSLARIRVARQARKGSRLSRGI